MLHIIKDPQTISEALQYSIANDKFLLMEDAVYAVLPGHKLHGLIEDSGRSLFVLQADLQARGLEIAGDSLCEIVDFYGFVELTAEEDKSVTW